MAIKKDRDLDKLEKMPEYQAGLWSSPYVKIYSIGGTNRIAEISNYPRAYKDTASHDYAENVPFTVTKSNLNAVVEGKEVHKDSKNNTFSIGEKATHWKGDSLPGEFPLWVESEDLPFVPDLEKHVFPIDKIPGPILDLFEGEIKAGSVFTKLSKQTLIAMRKQLSTGGITRGRDLEDSNKQIIRIRYRKVF